MKGNNISNALGIIETTIQPSEERDEIVRFIQKSDRGVMRGYRVKSGSES
jgi:UDP-N-acetylglucosamine acyltransferase